MAKISVISISAVKYPDLDDSVHITGLGFSHANTLCGITDDGEPEDTDETPSCTACIELYESIKKHKPRFKF